MSLLSPHPLVYSQPGSTVSWCPSLLGLSWDPPSLKVQAIVLTSPQGAPGPLPCCSCTLCPGPPSQHTGGFSCRKHRHICSLLECGMFGLSVPQHMVQGLFSIAPCALAPTRPLKSPSNGISFAKHFLGFPTRIPTFYLCDCPSSYIAMPGAALASCIHRVLLKCSRAFQENTLHSSGKSTEQGPLPPGCAPDCRSPKRSECL